MASFERAVHKRMVFNRQNPKRLAASRLQAEADLAGLAEHTLEPRILSKEDFRMEDYFGHSKQYRHREKNSKHPSMPINLVTCRPVSRDEFMQDETAMQAYWKEWENLEVKGVWDWDSLDEWDNISSNARAQKREIHFGYLFGFMVIKFNRETMIWCTLL